MVSATDRDERPTAWEPEPLHLPAEEPSDSSHSGGERTRRAPADEDSPGSHVIVIELA